MKLVGVLLSFLISVNLFAQKIELKLKMDFKKGMATRSMKTRVLAELGQKFEVPFSSKNSIKFSMIVVDKFQLPENSKIKKKDVVLIKSQVYIKENGKERLVATPKVITKYQNEATIEIASENGEKFKMKVTPSLKL